MHCTVNGEPMAFDHPPTVAMIATSIGAPPRGVAVAIDRVVIPRSAWEGTLVHEGAQVEVVTAAAGG